MQSVESSLGEEVRGRAPFAESVERVVSGETRQALSDAWARVPDSLRGPRQFLGRQYAGCGALIGAMPRCDFACRSCYLAGDPNRTPALPLSALEDQVRTLRAWLGEGGNLQLTDGEVALRGPDELIELVKLARRHGLVPMLMTHGEGVRRNPRLLERLMREGGLREISIHIDTTQRGRRQVAYKHATREEELNPLRDEFADLIRAARRNTGLPIEVATTVTVAPESLDEVPTIVRWALRNADAFKMVSFQPSASVGRTVDKRDSTVSVNALWESIGKGLQSAWRGTSEISSHHGWLGDPRCTLFLQGIVLSDDSGARFEPLIDPNDACEAAVLEEAFERFGGLTFRLDTPRQAFGRATRLIAANSGYVFTRLIPQIWRSSARIACDGRLRTLGRIATRKTRVRYLNLVSHHFMNAGELATQEGQERLALCSFQVPIDGELRSMCEVNALGLRESFYAELRAGRPGGTETPVSTASSSARR